MRNKVSPNYINVELTLTQIYNGGKIPFEYERKHYGKTIIVPVKGKLEPIEKIETVKMYFELSPGHPSEKKIVLKNKGDVKKDYEQGDIIIDIIELEHPFFIRKMDDLIININITLKESLLGVKKYIYHLDSNKIEIEYNDIISPKDEFRIKSKGMGKKGNLIIKWNTVYPETLTESQKDMIESIF